MTMKESYLVKNKYWSKRKRYGWGWTPVTWQGWTAVGVWAVFILGGMSYVNESSPSSVWIYISSVFLSIIPLFLIFYKTGPSPRWRWGKKPGDDPELDW